ncbi:MAG: hypothetical protein IPJ16_13045 [Bacteroidales bacterium]|nr:hypothetical protein [Bacteroidales bacterium]
MNKEIDDTIKKIALSIIQFDAAIKAGDPKGISEFLKVIPSYASYFKLRVPDKYEEKIHFLNFQKEVFSLFTALFVEGSIYKVAETLFIKNGDIKMQGDIPSIKTTPLTREIDKIGRDLNILVCKYDGPITDMKNIRWERNPLYKLSDEEIQERMSKKSDGSRIFNEFVSKYKGLYDKKAEPDIKERLSLQESALISAYEGKVILREEGKINQFYNYYSKRRNRIAIETTRKKTYNKIDRIEKIIPHLSKSAQQTAIDEVNTLKSALEKETF